MDVASVFTPLGWLWDLLGFVIGLALYFLPTIIAASRRATRMPVIVLVNVFLGWTLVGWVVALVLALTVPQRPRY